MLLIFRCGARYLGPIHVVVQFVGFVLVCLGFQTHSADVRTMVVASLPFAQMWILNLSVASAWLCVLPHTSPSGVQDGRTPRKFQHPWLHHLARLRLKVPRLTGENVPRIWANSVDVGQCWASPATCGAVWAMFGEFGDLRGDLGQCLPKSTSVDAVWADFPTGANLFRFGM